MEALIHHFKLVTEGFRVPPASSTTRSRDRGGSWAASSSPTVVETGARPFPRPVFVNLQAFRDMSVGGYVADLIQNLAMLDPILGGIDR